jgi:hypothetical protein
MFNAEKDIKKWEAVLEHESVAPIADPFRKAVTAKLLENTEVALKEERGYLTENNTQTSAVQNNDPVLISLVRRAMPQIIAFDVASVQPMSGPTGLIFAMKARYNGQGTDAVSTSDPEALGLDEADTAFTGTGTHGGTPSSLGGVDAAPVDGIDDAFATGRGFDTNIGETLGTAGNEFSDMGFTIEKSSVEAKTRGLKAEYTMEMAQDLKNIHGLDADSEIASILQTEVLAEMNREIIRTINVKAKLGVQGATAPGTYDLATGADSDGRWAVEKFKSLMFEIEKEANQVAIETRRGKANVLLCSSNVASALAAAGYLDYTPAISANLNVDATGNLFAGTLQGRMKVYVDPYAQVDYANVIYRGSNTYDAGLFYCPYVPLTMLRATDENTFQPKVGFKTRYGLKAHPFVQGAESGDGLGDNRANQYFRIFRVINI